MQMPEGPVGELAHSVLRDHREPHVPELGEQHHQHAPHAIGDDEHCGDGGQAEDGKPGDSLAGRLSGEKVDHGLVGDRHRERDDLGDDERREREQNARAQSPAGWPARYRGEARGARSNAPPVPEARCRFSIAAAGLASRVVSISARFARQKGQRPDTVTLSYGGAR